MQPISIPIRVYIEDTDAGGIVYYVNYLKYMERARTEFLRACGQEQSRTFETDTGFVVHALEAKYLSPARLDDLVDVTCEVEGRRAASVTFQQEVRSRRTGEVHCRASVRVVCISLAEMKPKAFPPGTFGEGT